MTSRDKVLDRSGRACEALVCLHDDARGLPVWTRCFKTPIEVHHRLTRARGGAVLDQLGETYHLIALCPGHHRDADGKSAYQSGLLLDGMMVRNGAAHYYVGSDPYLSARYPRPGLRSGERHVWRSGTRQAPGAVGA